MRRDSDRSLIRATGVLTAGNALNRALGMVYRMVVSRYLGAEGLGLFQMAMSLYFAVLSPFISGLPPALAQAVAAYRTEGVSPQTRLVVKRVAVLALLLLAVGSGVALSLDWTPPGESWQLARELVPLRVLLPALALAVVSAVLRGVFFGQQHVTPVVAAQFTEQSARVAMLGALLAGAGASLALGAKLHWVLWNLVLGEIITCGLLLRAYRQLLDRPWVVRRAEGTPPRTRAVLLLAVPIGLQRAAGGAERLLEATLIPGILQQAGSSVRDAVAAYGELTGMVVPILFLPSIFVHALTHTLVPGVAEVKDRPEQLHRRVRRALLITTEVGVLTTVLLVFWGSLLARWLFDADPGAGYPFAGRVADLFAPLAAFLYLDHVASSVLRGLGKGVPPLITDLAGMALRLGLMVMLGLRAQWGLPGVAVAMGVALAATCLANVLLAVWYTRLPLASLGRLMQLYVAGAGGYAAGKVVVLAFAAGNGGSATTALGASAAALLVYGLVRLGAR